MNSKSTTDRLDSLPNRHVLLVVLFCLLILFFIQMAGTLVESIYILNLLQSSLNIKAAGVAFFFSPLLLLALGRRAKRALLWGSAGLLALGRAIVPFLGTDGRLLASGAATSAALVLIPIILADYLPEGRSDRRLIPAQGLALSIGLSVFLRTLNFSLDYSLEPGGEWLGWVLSLLLGVLLVWLRPGTPAQAAPEPKGVVSSSVGVVSILTLAYFAFSSPAVIARWTEESYRWIVIVVSGISLAWVLFSSYKPRLFSGLKPKVLITWNLLFTLALTGLILSHTIQFPPAVNSPPVVVGANSWYHPILLALTLLLFPVIFFDFAVFAGVIADAGLSRRLGLGFSLGALFLVVLVFMIIFTNVWGYVDPVSPLFRNKFWLPFLLLAGVLTVVAWRLARMPRLFETEEQSRQMQFRFGIVIMFALTLWWAVYATDRTSLPDAEKRSLVVMTYNIQQANDIFGEKSYQRQLALIKEVDPDILALQESDSARIGLNNNDYVRFFADELGYYSYYGPKTVTGTYGTALLSRYPLENPRSVFTYSDQDEFGTVEIEIVVGGKRFTIFNVHPDGSDEAMLAFAQTLLARARDKANVITLGDFNLRDYEEAYQLIDAVYKNAWISLYPTGIDEYGLDMSGENRIDHIFVSQHLEILSATYLLPPESWTDHPAHWAEITW